MELPPEDDLSTPEARSDALVALLTVTMIVVIGLLVWMMLP